MCQSNPPCPSLSLDLMQLIDPHNVQIFNADVAIIGLEYSLELRLKASQRYPLLLAALLQEAYAFDAIGRLDIPNLWLISFMIVAYTHSSL